jgi:hypothetical protein
MPMNRIAVAAAVLAPAVLGLVLSMARYAAPVSDYDLELTGIDAGLAGLQRRLAGGSAGRQIAMDALYQYYLRASLSHDYQDFAATEAAIDRIGKEFGPGADLYTIRAHLYFKLRQRDKLIIVYIDQYAVGSGRGRGTTRLGVYESHFAQDTTRCEMINSAAFDGDIDFAFDDDIHGFTQIAMPEDDFTSFVGTTSGRFLEKAKSL